MIGRSKKPRIISIDIQKLINKNMGPLGYTKTQLKTLPVCSLYPDEVQALAWRDVEGLNMLDAAQKMGISKTVFAGIYTSARTKLSTALIRGEIIDIESEIPNMSSDMVKTPSPRKKQTTKKAALKKVVKKAVSTPETTDTTIPTPEIKTKKSEKDTKKSKKKKNKKKSKKDKKKKKK